MKVSIIMPVYNSEQYLEQAVNSILEQDFSDYELILVDDGSQDGSGAICDRFGETSDHVRVIHKQNGGICSARNAGLRAAEGEYIGFCDNDDAVMPGFLKKPYEAAAETGADIVRFRRKRIVTQNGETLFESTTGGTERFVFSGSQIRDNYLKIKRYGGGVWTGLYRTEMLRKNGIVFNEDMKVGVEDLFFNVQCLKCCRKIVLLPETLYTWMQRTEHSTSGRFNINLRDSLKWCMLEEKDLFAKYAINTPGIWEYVVTTDYIVELYVRLDRRRSTNLTDEERKKILMEFRNDRELDFEGRKGASRYIWKTGWKNGVIWELFRKKKIWLLYRLIYRGI